MIGLGTSTGEGPPRIPPQIISRLGHPIPLPDGSAYETQWLTLDDQEALTVQGAAVGMMAKFLVRVLTIESSDHGTRFEFEFYEIIDA